MKRAKILLVLLLFLIVFIISVVISAKYFSAKYSEKKQLKIANNIISNGNKNETEIITNNELEENENVIGILEIPKIDLIAPIQEGTDLDTLKVAIGHFSESSFWTGNVALASHNRSKYVQYFERINELQSGDEIIYKTKFGTRKYIVYDSKIIESTDWSVIENTENNIITLITCIMNDSSSRLCVKAKELK